MTIAVDLGRKATIQTKKYMYKTLGVGTQNNRLNVMVRLGNQNTC